MSIARFSWRPRADVIEGSAGEITRRFESRSGLGQDSVHGVSFGAEPALSYPACGKARSVLLQVMRRGQLAPFAASGLVAGERDGQRRAISGLCSPKGLNFLAAHVLAALPVIVGGCPNTVPFLRPWLSDGLRSHHDQMA